MNGGGGNTVVRCDLRGRAIITKYGNTLIVRQAGFRVLRPIPSASMLAPVDDVVSVGIPSEICQTTIRRNTIVMASFHTFGAPTNKSLKDQSVYQMYTPMSSFAESDPWVAFFRKPGREYPPTPHSTCCTAPSICIFHDSGDGSHKPVIADFVTAFIARDRFPYFIHTEG